MKQKLKPIIQQAKMPVTISLTVTVIVISLSLTGIFRILELAIWDQFFRIRPPQEKDSKIIIVAIDEKDIQNIDNWPLSDEKLATLLIQIKNQKPRVIGLDIFRDLPVDSGYQKLAKVMESTPNLIGVGKFSGDKIPPPPVLTKLNQISAADLISDRDSKIRRGLLSIEEKNNSTIFSLGAKLALIYLEKENITLKPLKSYHNFQTYKLGKAYFKPFTKNDGGYINARIKGYQIILNFPNKPCQINNFCSFEIINLRDVLNNQIPADLMRDKIVLIGTTSKSLSDFFYNPYSYDDETTISGVEIHAHIASQIVNAALNGNNLIKTLPEFIEWLWILFFSTISSILSAKYLKQNLIIIYLFLPAFLFLNISYILFLNNWWIPVATPLISMITSGVTSVIYTLWANLKDSYQELEKYASSLEEKVKKRTQDLTYKQKELEQKNQQLETQNIQLIEARKIADNASQAKSRFLANMSHELRTPLNAIIGFSQLMNKSKKLNSDDREYVSIINRSGEHLLSLINDVLDMSKIEAERMFLDEKIFDLYQMLKTVEDMLNIKAKVKQLSFLFEINNSVPQYIIADEKKLKQVLLNLLNNSLKFTDQGFVKLTVNQKTEKENCPQSKDEQAVIKLLFTIEDTGRGIKEEEISKLFNPFEQTETGKNSAEGTGLGLAISDQFVRLMNGKITVKSIINQGTNFEFYIQIKLPEKKESILFSNNRNIIGIELTDVPPKILIVDDVMANIKLLEAILSPVGFAIKKAENGQQALKIWEHWQPDLIFMDIEMPVLNGYETAKKIREKEQRDNNLLSKKRSFLTQKETIIIAITASVFKHEESKVYEAGCNDLIRKPFVENTIFETVKSYLKLNYIYENDNEEVISNSETLENNHFLEDNQIKSDLQQMSLEWRKSVYESANKGSDEELSRLIAAIPSDLKDLQQLLTDLTNEFCFEKIIFLFEDLIINNH